MKVLMVIAPEMFRDEEYAEPRAALEDAGVEVTVASSILGSCKGKLGMVASSDILLAEAEAEDYDGVVFVGGGGAEGYFLDPDAHSLARDAAAAGKVVGAICIAPAILANAGLLQGRRATAFPSVRAELTAGGARYTGTPVEVDGNIVTANGPEAASQFGFRLVQELGA